MTYRRPLVGQWVVKRPRRALASFGTGTESTVRSAGLGLIIGVGLVLALVVIASSKG